MSEVQIHGAVRANEIAAVLALLAGRAASLDSPRVEGIAGWQAKRRAALAARPVASGS